MAIALTNCRVFDGTTDLGAGKALVLDGDRIGEVIDSSNVSASLATLDLGGATLLPGLIDCHIHYAMWGMNPGGHADDFIMMLAAKTAAAMRAALASGITSARDPGGLEAGFRDAVAQGVIPGPRVQTGINIISPTNGVGDRVTNQNVAPNFVPAVPNPVCDGPVAARAKVREMIRCGADFVKVAMTGGVSAKRVDPHQQLFRQDEIEAIVDEAHQFNRPVICHALGGPGVLTAVRAGVDTIEHGGYLDAETIKEMSARGTWYIPTFAIYRSHTLLGPEYKQRRASAMREHHLRSFHQAREAGVRIALGSDAGGYDYDSLAELECLVDAGMTPAEALAAGTSRAAECLHIDDEVGTIRAGMLADLVVVDGDPMSDVSVVRKAENIRLVVQGGKAVAGTMLATEAQRLLPGSR